MANEATKQTLAQLGVNTPEKIPAIFAELRARFDKECDDMRRVGVAPRDAWDALRLSWQGRKSGVLSQVTDNWLKAAPPELKPAIGQELNELKSHIETKLEDDLNNWKDQADLKLGTTEDLSLPGIERAIGTRHLIRQTSEELQRIFLSIGFSVVEGPEIETPYYNFEALNIPEHHPARDNMDTFYIEGAKNRDVLRTHTSPMQIRTMEKQAPPVRIVVPGKVYRRDNPDATHGWRSIQTSRSAISRVPWNILCALFWDQK
jgi:phenylalanyl-tRNA synthetase alpha chain